MERFLRKIRAKLRAKALMFTDQLELAGLGRIRDFQEFDDRYTAPIHGFKMLRIIGRETVVASFFPLPVFLPCWSTRSTILF